MPARDYMGCYWDKGYPGKTRQPCDLPVVKRGHCTGVDHATHALHVSASRALAPLTLAMCGTLCKGHLYCGVQNGGSGCVCGASYGRYGTCGNQKKMIF